LKQTGRELDDNRFALAPESAAPVSETAPVHDPSAGFVRIARLHWRAIAITIALTTVIAALLVVALPKHYRATAIGAVAPRADSLTPSETFHGIEALDRRSVVATVAALPATALPPTRDYDVSAVVLPNTNLVRIDVDAPTPEIAASIANATLSELAGQTSSMFRYYGVTPVRRAVPPIDAASPRRGRIVASGLIVGLFLGAGVAYALSRLSTAPV